MTGCPQARLQGVDFVVVLLILSPPPHCRSAWRRLRLCDEAASSQSVSSSHPAPGAPTVGGRRQNTVFHLISVRSCLLGTVKNSVRKARPLPLLPHPRLPPCGPCMRRRGHARPAPGRPPLARRVLGRYVPPEMCSVLCHAMCIPVAGTPSSACCPPRRTPAGCISSAQPHLLSLLQSS